MKKLLALCIFVLSFGCTAFAEKEIKYSLVAPSLPEKIYDEGLNDKPISFFGDVDLSAGDTESWEDEFYAKLDSVYSPEKIVNQTVGSFSNGSGYYIFAPYVDFKVDYSLGSTKDEQGWARAEQIHEVYVRYLQNNPEYFYLMPRQYGMYVTSIGLTKIRVWLAPAIAYGEPEFDGSKKALYDLKAKYEELMAEIDKIKEEIYFEGMTDLDKLLLAHDYIIDNAAYYYIKNEDGTAYYGDGFSYNSYGILVNKKGVCQGLSYAYPCILKALGFPIENIRQIRSDEIKHMWNLVKLEDTWYHVDLTWDDPLYANADGVYDMNDDAYQFEEHDFFLLSDTANTNGRIAEGYKSFTLEVLGYDDTMHTLADDASFESGYFFNDPTNGRSSIRGKIEYEDGYYKKYYKNEEVFFLSDTLKAPDFMVSQITYNQYGVPMVWVLGANKRVTSNENLIHYLGYYDKDGRLLKIKAENRELLYFGMYPVDTFEEPQDGTTLKIITLDSSFRPTANVPIIK